MKNLNKEWLHAALIRAVRTFAQTALSMLTLGLAVTEVQWVHILSVSTVSAVYSILTSLSTGLPEAKNDGELIIDSSGETSVYRFAFNSELTDLATKNHVSFIVKKEAINSSQE